MSHCAYIRSQAVNCPLWTSEPTAPPELVMKIGPSKAVSREWRDGSLPGEEWRNLVLQKADKRTSAAYQISSFGRLRSRLRPNGGLDDFWHLLRGHTNQGGYRCYNIRGTSHFAHRLVAFAFLGSPAPSQEVRHLDGNPLNNNCDNLAWGTSVENAADRLKHGTLAEGEKNGWSVLNGRQVKQIIQLWKKGKLRYQIAQQFKTTPENIGKILNGATWRHFTGLSPEHPDVIKSKRQSTWQARGERNSSKLTAQQVMEIVHLCKNGKSQRGVARMFNVSSTTILRIMHGRKWQSVTGIVPDPL